MSIFSIFSDQNDYEPVTAILDTDGNQLFKTIGILSVGVSRANQFAKHTLEDNTVVVDNKTKLQKQIVVKAILSPDDYVQAYQEIISADEDSTRFTIQTRVDTYDNMYIESIPYEESAKMSNTIALILTFVEQQFVGVETSKLPESEVKKPVNSDTVKSGTKSTKELSTSKTETALEKNKKSSTLYRIFN